MTTTAETAKAIRATLKTAYPAEIFSVTSRSFAGGDDVNVDWTDGPTSEAVNALLKEYEGGHFDPMNDLYTYNKLNPNHPTAKYVFGNRHFSKEAYAEHRAVVCAKYDIPTDTNDDQDVIQIGGHAYLGQLVTHELHQMDLTPKTVAELARTEADEICSEEDLEAAAAFMDKLDHIQEQ